MGFMDREAARLAQLHRSWKRHMQVLEIISEVAQVALAPLSETSVIGWKLRWSRTVLGY